MQFDSGVSAVFLFYDQRLDADQGHRRQFRKVDMRKVMFLPGAGGSAEFWKPAGSRLPVAWSPIYFAWPGLGDQPHDPDVNGIDDLTALVLAKIDSPVDVVAQSLGGVIAVRIALANPGMVRRLVLTATSGGVNMARFGASDWRADYRILFPNAAQWITQRHSCPDLAVERISSPTLLIWGDADSISPTAVGRYLERRIPNARLRIIPGGDHDLAINQADVVASLITDHLA